MYSLIICFMRLTEVLADVVGHLPARPAQAVVYDSVALGHDGDSSPGSASPLGLILIVRLHDVTLKKAAQLPDVLFHVGMPSAYLLVCGTISMERFLLFI